VPIHLSELHGAATHLAVVAIPVYLLVLLARWAAMGGETMRKVQPWVETAAAAGVVLAGVTGLLVWGQAQTTLRGSAFRLGTLHFWLGIGLSVVVVVSVGWQHWHRRQGRRHTYRAFVAPAVVAVAAVLVQGYVGGRMTYQHAVGIFDGGQLSASAAGAKRLEVALASGVAPATAGKQAFSAQGLGCARCHGELAQGERGPRLAGGVELGEFRGVHGHGLFPPAIVSDRDFQAIDAWLRTLPRG
jgi:mono/diheme cytochrome c family protein